MTVRRRSAVQLVLPLAVPRLSRLVRAALVDHIAPGWLSDAACVTSTVSPDAWHADPKEPDHTAARAVCASCPVRRSCLAHALAHDEPEGLWGGADESERVWLRLALADGVPVPAVLGPTSSAAVA